MPSGCCWPSRTCSASCSSTAASTSAGSSTTCRPPSSWRSTATTSVPSSAPGWSSSCSSAACCPDRDRARRASRRGGRWRYGHRSMISLDEAIAAVLAGCPPLAPCAVPLADAAGCVLAADVVAAEAVPPFVNSAMDGYAVRADDVATVPVELPVVAEVAAGHPVSVALEAGQAMRIFTGAPLPEGADTIVMVEDTERLDGGTRVAIRRGAPVGAHVRAAGDDVQPGD